MRLRCLAYNIGGGCADNLEALYAILAHTQPDVAALTDVMAEVRRTLRAGGISLDAECWRGALDDELRRLAAAGRTAEARTRLLERLGV